MIRKPKNSVEKTHGALIEMLSFCDSCKSIKLKYRDGKIFWQYSVVCFDNLPKEQCFACMRDKV